MGDHGNPSGVLLGIDSGWQLIACEGQRDLAVARPLARWTRCFPDNREAAYELHGGLIPETPRKLLSELQFLVAASVVPSGADLVPIDARQERDGDGQ